MKITITADKRGGCMTIVAVLCAAALICGITYEIGQVRAKSEYKSNAEIWKASAEANAEKARGAEESVKHLNGILTEAKTIVQNLQKENNDNLAKAKRLGWILWQAVGTNYMEFESTWPTNKTWELKSIPFKAANGFDMEIFKRRQ